MRRTKRKLSAGIAIRHFADHFLFWPAETPKLFLTLCNYIRTGSFSMKKNLPVFSYTFRIIFRYCKIVLFTGNRRLCLL